ncbi:uncharacterized protein SCHCODRAFT_02624119 [Schizophyllum commune H4-8]|uniref:uncharacterized protein n=1 Tax=Schizophyllum commune (strain H4-8 / FGSC 9210) TaxID=578458 RepID=UPI00215EE023|nr:uncharacterized protein SCHCODRAFT_02624119 [Schizophyllum commune H4-8]KAI5894235.1 hypothetical protein SCHCODRAFT_02624119 [Schizophyllum commune H4-8]
MTSPSMTPPFNSTTSTSSNTTPTSENGGRDRDGKGSLTFPSLIYPLPRDKRAEYRSLRHLGTPPLVR